MSLDTLFNKLKGGVGSGNHNHTSIKGKRGGSASKGYVGSVLGADIYKISGKIGKDFLESEHSAFMITPQGELYGWSNGNVKHAEVVGSSLFNDNKNFDKYIRVDFRADKQDQFNGKKYLLFDSALGGVGALYGNDEEVDIKAEKNFKKFSKVLNKLGVSQSTNVKWVTYDQNEIKGTLADWI